MHRTLLVALAGVAASALGAQAADLRPVTKAPPAPYVAPAPTWTGFYVGGHIGGAWTDTNWSVPLYGAGGSQTTGSFLGGGEVGANYQIGTWVLGVEGDGSWTNASVTAPCGAAFCQAKLDWISTVTGRLGYAMGPVLLYGKGGAAWGHDQYTVNAASLPSGTASDTRSGWTAGLGLEYMFDSNWSAKAEYNYVDLGSTSPNFPAGTGAAVDQKEHLVKFGVNYRFNWDNPLSR